AAVTARRRPYCWLRRISCSVACLSSTVKRRRSCSFNVATTRESDHAPHSGPERNTAPATASVDGPELQTGSTKPRLEPFGPSAAGQPQSRPDDTTLLPSCIWTPASTTTPLLGLRSHA